MSSTGSDRTVGNPPLGLAKRASRARLDRAAAAVNIRRNGEWLGNAYAEVPLFPGSRTGLICATLTGPLDRGLGGQIDG